MKSASSARGRARLVRVVFTLLVAGAWGGQARADIALTRSGGPESGSAFANAGRALGANREVPVAMRSATVDIVLSKKNQSTLHARCMARFELENTATSGEAAGFEVAFPLTGLTAGPGFAVMKTRNFAVEVDGVAPAAVRLTSAELANGKEYPTAYVWSQTLAPGKRQAVTVSYTLDMLGQRTTLDPARSLGISSRDAAKLSAKRVYSFFDYVLESGASWEGPIGREVITLSGDGVDLGWLVSFGRQPTRKGKTWVWEIVNEKPTQDVRLALPW